MTRLPFVLPAIAVAVLAGCAAEPKTAPAPAPVVVLVPQPSPSTAGTVAVAPAVVAPAVVAPAAVPLRAGYGRIESILAVPSAAAGAGASTPTRRIAMRMDDGSVQQFDTQVPNLTVGDRIEITTNGTLRHPA
ncbi:MAG TPA: hypothetical protein VFB93_09695 [Burkholderiales bacterium]|nr:hypothetical protein [Burkholderiales bacterium]